MRGEREMGRTGKGTALTISFGVISVILDICLIATVYASGGGGESKDGSNLVGFAWKLFNFVVIAGAVYWFSSKKIGEFFAGRREGIQKSLSEAAAAREDAEKKFREYEAKLDRATVEIDEITGMIKAQGQTERERIIADARKAAEKMKEDTQARMEQEFSKASHKLRVEAVRLSAQIADELLRKNIRVEDHEEMVKDYIEQIVRKN